MNINIFLPWDEIPKEVREVLLVAQALVDSAMPMTNDFPMPFVNPHILEDLKKALYPFTDRYYLSHRNYINKEKK